MKRIASKKTVFLLLFLFSAAGAYAGINEVRINEILVKNIDSYEDDYGHRVGWFELFNSGYAQVDIGGAYIKVKGKEYRIPKNDKNTVIPPQGYVVFFAEGTASKGTFYTNFTLDETDYIALYDQSGRGKVIDSVYYNINEMKPDISVGWYEDHDGVMHFGALDATTPFATNDTLDKIPRSEHFRQADPYGIVMTLTAVSVVFLALIVLYLIFKHLGKTLVKIATKKEKKAREEGKPSAASIAKKRSAGDVAGEEVAAIALALYKYSEELHDIENTVLTINRAAKAYSPWNSKIYGLRITPIKK